MRSIDSERATKLRSRDLSYERRAVCTEERESTLPVWGVRWQVWYGDGDLILGRDSLSQSQVLLTKIRKLCSEICAIKEENKSNKYLTKLPESRNNPKPQNSHIPAVLDTYDEHALHVHETYDSIPNPQTHLSYTHDTSLEYEAPLAQMLSLQMPDLLSPSRASSPDCKDACEDPSELTEQDPRGGIVGPSSAKKKGVEIGGDPID